VELSSAVSEIAQAVRGARERKEPTSPFFFLVGSGISTPVVPGAAGIEALCRAKAGATKVDEPVSAMSRYSFWFERAFPQPRERQALIDSLVRNKPISSANLRLAHLLIDQTVSGLVLTPNFDPFLTRALTMFGVEHLVCDHPLLADRIDPNRSIVQIVHMHGSHWYYDACNLATEIAARAQPAARTRRSMMALLADTLRFRSPIVIGYSGWPDDVFMQALHIRLGEPEDAVTLPYNVYWFCHSRAHADILEPWLARHPQVRIVIPEDDPIGTPRGTDPFGAVANPVPQVSGGASSALGARDVFEALLSEFGVRPPNLTTRPLTFFASRLRGELINEDVDPSADIYRIGALVDTVESADVIMASREAGLSSSLRMIDEKIRSADYAAAIRVGRDIALDTTDQNTAQALFDSLWLAALGLRGNPLIKSEGYDMVVSLGRRLGAQEPRIAQRIARARLFQSAELAGHGRTRQALAAIEDAISMFGSLKDPAPVDLATALIQRGTILWRLREYSEELASYEEAIVLIGHRTDPESEQLRARAIDFKITTLAKLERNQEALAAVDDLIDRFSDTRDPEIQTRVLRAAAASQAYVDPLSEKQARLALASALYEDSDDASVNVERAGILTWLGIAQRLSDDRNAAIDTFSDVIARYGDNANPEIAREVALARASLGRLHVEAGDVASGLTHLDALKEFKSADPELVRHQVDGLLLAAQQRLTLDPEQARLDLIIVEALAARSSPKVAREVKMKVRGLRRQLS
jgi:tetratricopeptide (TPR) repeat protein